MEVMIETKTYLVHMRCSQCCEGYMLDETTEEELQIAMTKNNPTPYKHVCDKCGYEENYEMSYPYPKLVPVNEV